MLQDMVGELIGTLPGLDPFQAKTYLNRAWRSIRDIRLWGFLRAEAVIVCPVQISTGTIAIVQFVPTVLCDALATVALTGLANPPITSRQIRFAGGQIYNILSIVLVGPFLQLTLDRAVQEPTAVASTYQVYRCYATAPADFLRWHTLVDFVNGYPMKLDRSRAELDRIDPQRSSSDQALWVVTYSPDPTTGLTRGEFWPHPSGGQTFIGIYRRIGVDLAAPLDALPSVISEGLVVQKALMDSGLVWGQINAGRFPHMKNQRSLIETKTAMRESYKIDLRSAIKQDDAQTPQRVLSRGHGLGRGVVPPIGDAAFWQAHGIYW